MKILFRYITLGNGKSIMLLASHESSCTSYYEVYSSLDHIVLVSA